MILSLDSPEDIEKVLIVLKATGSRAVTSCYFLLLINVSVLSKWFVVWFIICQMMTKTTLMLPQNCLNEREKLQILTINQLIVSALLKKSFVFPLKDTVKQQSEHL